MSRLENIKAVILAGGLGTRISEETKLKPKPMVEIGGKPILWHIMKIYSTYGINDFIICLGYKGAAIRDFFSDYFLNHADVTFDFNNNSMLIHGNKCEPWKVTLVDTGDHAMTGSRIKQIQKYIDGTFMVTYGDGLADIDLHELLKFHYCHRKIATISSYQYEEKFGVIKFEKNNLVNRFKEKPKNNNWINMGFFVFEPEIFKYIDEGLGVVLEKEPMERLVRDSQLVTYQHFGFWKCMDTLNDKNILEEMWQSDPKWAVWNAARRLSS